MFEKSLLLLISALFLSKAAHFKVTSQVNLDIEINGENIGRITIGLFDDDSPKTVANFRHISTNGINGRTYAGTPFHRVIDRFIIQGGDIVSKNGRGSVSIYGKHFEDENLTINHTGPGFIGMANSGLDKNGCQFYITTMASPWLNGKHTIFGKVVKGAGYVHTIEKSQTDPDRVPLKRILISACSDEPMSSYYYISDNPYDLYSWIRASAIPLGFSFSILAFFHVLIKKLDNLTKKTEEKED